MKNPELHPENPLSYICSLFTSLARITNEGGDREKHKLPRFSLGQLISSLREPLQTHNDLFQPKRLAKFEKAYEDLSAESVKPLEEGTQIVLTMLPCTVLGQALLSTHFDAEICPDSPFLAVFYRLPEDKVLSINHGGSHLQDFMGILPEEILRDCSFTVKYPAPGQAQSDDEIAEQNCLYLKNSLRDNQKKLAKLLQSADKKDI